MCKLLPILSLCLLVCSGCHKQSCELPTSSINKLPAMYIDIDDVQKDSIYTNREHKADAFATIVSVESDTIYENFIRIKTRGNSTWGQSKKPFSIELEKGISLFNIPKTKDFVLLACVHDESYIRNSIAFELAHQIGLATPKASHIRVYFNNEYAGLYLLTNKIKVGKHNVNINDLGKQNKLCNPLPLTTYQWFSHGKLREIGQHKGRLLPTNPDDITGGYLLDNTGMNWQYERIESGFVSQAGDPIRIRSPKYASVQQVDYIADFYDNMEIAIMDSCGYNPYTHKHYTEYIDIKSFAEYYALNELLLNEDAGLCSFYMYKDPGETSKMYAGPIWDFDCAILSPCMLGIFHSSQEIYAAAKMGEFGEPHSGNLLYHLCRHEDFIDSVKIVYTQELYPAVKQMLESNYIDSLQRLLAVDADIDNPKYLIRHSPSYYDAIKIIVDFLNERKEFLYWLWTNGETEKICIKITGNNYTHVPHEREICLYGNPNDGVVLPSLKQQIVFNRDPILVWFSIDDNRQLQAGDTIRESQTIEIRQIPPSWLKVQKRRIKKKFHRIFK